jgi:hypothetical protein
VCKRPPAVIFSDSSPPFNTQQHSNQSLPLLTDPHSGSERNFFASENNRKSLSFAFYTTDSKSPATTRILLCACVELLPDNMPVFLFPLFPANSNRSVPVPCPPIVLASVEKLNSVNTTFTALNFTLEVLTDAFIM